ncbi:MAG: hypothetical protein LQ339_003919 [Xanthoria mediterranea]|nr:MAG: hypothetical protein LQ339_003919 [Xanthoria mediterranea]
MLDGDLAALPEDQVHSGPVSPDHQIGESSSMAKSEDEEAALMPADNGDNDETPDQNSRVQYVKREFDDAGHRRVVPGKRMSTTTTSSAQEGSNNTAFVVTEYWGSNKIKEKTEILLKGRNLREIMYEVYGKLLEHEQLRGWVEQEQTISQPFEYELWYWNELSDAAKSSCGSEQGRQDLQLLLDHLLDIEPDRIKVAKSTASLTRVSTKDLWLLFRPGTDVIAKPYLNEPQLFRVEICHYKETSFIVHTWALDWTGTELKRECYEFILHWHEKDDEKLTITELNCYPVRYYTSGNGDRGLKALEAEVGLTERGRKFRKLCRESQSGTHHDYDGELLYDATRRDSILKKKKAIKGNIKIDFAAYKQYSPAGGGPMGNLCPEDDTPCKCRLCLDNTSNFSQWMQKFAHEDMDNTSADEDVNYIFLPARLLGYCFKTKVWAQFHVNRVRAIEIPDAETEMKKLIFPEESDIKQDLKILIEQHGSTELPMMIMDPIEGKGAGLVVLLHGPPGVGKTLTAETLAKCAGKPLYVVGASDAGLEPRIAEESLGRIFDLAETWGAVLLIDEADVFLDSRGSKGEADLSKNALVSVMLRALEYFKGILIMTTNRVMTFDVAMLSRCHYAVNFTSLTLAQEKEIWQSYVDQLTSKNSSGKQHIESWVKDITRKTKSLRTILSGREIRNVFTTAQTLAQAEPDKKIRKEHLERVYDRIIGFAAEMKENKSMQELHLNARRS